MSGARPPPGGSDQTAYVIKRTSHFWAEHPRALRSQHPRPQKWTRWAEHLLPFEPCANYEDPHPNKKIEKKINEFHWVPLKYFK